MIRLLLIDDHAIVREGFKRLFDAEADMQVIGEAGNAPKAIALDLGISDKSLYRLRANIMEKLGVPRVSELPRVIRERGLLPLL